MMKKPDDYNEYFFPDGRERKNPFFDENRSVTDLPKARKWSQRFLQVKMAMMPEDEREEYQKMLNNMWDRMASC